MGDFFMNNDNNGPLMFIDTYKDELKIDKVYKYDSRKIKKDNHIVKQEIELFKIYQYNEKMIIPYKLQDNKIYGIIISKIEGNVCLDLNESAKFEEIKL